MNYSLSLSLKKKEEIHDHSPLLLTLRKQKTASHELIRFKTIEGENQILTSCVFLPTKNKTLKIVQIVSQCSVSEVLSLLYKQI